MKYAIYKYPFVESDDVELGPRGMVDIWIPQKAEILTVQMTREGVPSIWALVNPGAEKKLRHFVVIGTGNGFEAHQRSLKYIGTVQEMAGSLVWHVFEFFDPELIYRER